MSKYLISFTLVKDIRILFDTATSPNDDFGYDRIVTCKFTRRISRLSESKTCQHRTAAIFSRYIIRYVLIVWNAAFKIRPLSIKWIYLFHTRWKLKIYNQKWKFFLNRSSKCVPILYRFLLVLSNLI